MNPVPRVQIVFATDPMCSHCWAMEPGWRKFLYFYGKHLSVRYLYGGLLPHWEGFSRGGITSPSAVAPHWAEVALESGQPIDPSVWLEDPPASSYPASIALLFVRQLQPEREEAYLRRVRQAIFLEARNIARTDVLVQCAVDVGLESEQFLTRLKQRDGEAQFERDLQEARRLQVNGFPTLFFQIDGEQVVKLPGRQTFAGLERTLLFLHRSAFSDHTASAREVLSVYQSGTTREFAEVLNLGPEETIQALIAAGAIQTPLAGDALWSLAGLQK